MIGKEEHLDETEKSYVRDEYRSDERASGLGKDRRGLGDESGIIVFGGGGSGCAGRGCLFWIVVSIVLSVTLTILINLILLLFSGAGAGVNV